MFAYSKIGPMLELVQLTNLSHLTKNVFLEHFSIFAIRKKNYPEENVSVEPFFRKRNVD
jgi:hypothetical protein